MNTAIEKVKVSELENEIITNNQLKDSLEDVAIININNNYYLYNTKTKENYFPIDWEWLTSLDLLNLELNTIKSKISSDLIKLKEQIKEPKTLTEAIDIFKKSEELDLSVFNKFFSSKLTSADLELLKLNLDKEKFEACLKLQLTRKNIDFKFEESNKGNSLDVFKKWLIQAYWDVVWNNYYNTLLVLSNNDEKKLEAQWIEFILQKNWLNVKLDELGQCCWKDWEVDARNLFEKKWLVGVADALLSETKMNKGQREMWLWLSQIAWFVVLIMGWFAFFKKYKWKWLLGLIWAEFWSQAVTWKSMMSRLHAVIYWWVDFSAMWEAWASVKQWWHETIRTFINNGKENFDEFTWNINQWIDSLDEGLWKFILDNMFSWLIVSDIGKYINQHKKTFDIDKYSDWLSTDKKELLELLVLDNYKVNQWMSKFLYERFDNQWILDSKLDCSVVEFNRKVDDIKNNLNFKKYKLKNNNESLFYEFIRNNFHLSVEQITELIIKNNLVEINTDNSPFIPIVKNNDKDSQWKSKEDDKSDIESKWDSSIEWQESISNNWDIQSEILDNETLESRTRTLWYIQDWRKYMIGSDGNAKLFEYSHLPQDVIDELWKSNILIQKVSYLNLMLQAENPQNMELLKTISKVDFLWNPEEINWIIEVVTAYLWKKYDTMYYIEYWEQVPNDFNIKSIMNKNNIDVMEVYKYIREYIGNYSMVESLLIEDKMDKLVWNISPEQLEDFYNLLENKTPWELYISKNDVVKLITKTFTSVQSQGLFKKLKEKLQEANEHINKNNEEINKQIKLNSSRPLNDEEFSQAKEIAKNRIKYQFVAYNLKKELVLNKLDDDAAASMLKWILWVWFWDLSDKTKDIGLSTLEFILIEAAAFAAWFVTMWVWTVIVKWALATRYLNRARLILESSKALQIWSEVVFGWAAFYQWANLVHNIVEDRALTHWWNDLWEIWKTIVFIWAMKWLAQMTSKIPWLSVNQNDLFLTKSFKVSWQVLIEWISLWTLWWFINIVCEGWEWTLEQFIDWIMLAIMMRAMHWPLKKWENYLLRKLPNWKTEVVAETKTLEHKKRELFQAEAELARLNNDLSILKSKSETLHKTNQLRIEQLKQELQVKESELLRLKDMEYELKLSEVEMIKQQLNNHKKELDTLREQRWKTESEIGQYKDKIHTLKEEIPLDKRDSGKKETKKTESKEWSEPIMGSNNIIKSFFSDVFKVKPIWEKIKLWEDFYITKTSNNMWEVILWNVHYQFKSYKDFREIILRESKTNNWMTEGLKSKTIEWYEQNLLSWKTKLDNITIDNVKYRLEMKWETLEVRKLRKDWWYEIIETNAFFNTHRVKIFENYITWWRKALQDMWLRNRSMKDVIWKEWEAKLKESWVSDEKVSWLRKKTLGEFVESARSANKKVWEAKWFSKMTTFFSEWWKIYFTWSNQPSLWRTTLSVGIGWLVWLDYLSSNDSDLLTSAIKHWLYTNIGILPAFFIWIIDAFDWVDILMEDTYLWDKLQDWNVLDKQPTKA